MPMMVGFELVELAEVEVMLYEGRFVAANRHTPTKESKEWVWVSVGASLASWTVVLQVGLLASSVI